MRLPDSAHRSIDWRVHDLANDFALWDVWRLPIDADEAAGQTFETVLGWFTRSAWDGTHRGLSGLLFRIRLRLGRLFGWDANLNTLPIPGCRESSLRERLEARELDSPAQFEAAEGLLFQRVYQTKREALYEVSNDTCHALLHLGRAADAGTRWAPQMAIYVKPRGLGGRLYLSMIAPFRHLIVYPSMMRSLRARWQKHTLEAAPLLPGMNEVRA